MEIKFELKDNEVKIMSGEKEIGQIFVDTTRKGKAVIQVCGFENAYALWGCGVFGENNGLPRKTESNNQDIFLGKTIQSDVSMKKDIQLLFKDYVPIDGDKHDRHMREASSYNEKRCCKCYNIPCNCENQDRGNNPFSVKTLGELKTELEKED